MTGQRADPHPLFPPAEPQSRPRSASAARSGVRTRAAPPEAVVVPRNNRPLKTFADMFCGIGGFHVAAARFGMECVFASDIDEKARDVYEANLGHRPAGDIADIEDANQLPDHDVLFAGLPCQPFSIIGERKGMADPRGTLFFETARIIEAKHPQAVVIENVRQFATNQDGHALRCVLETLEGLGYGVDWRLLNALDHGLPQRRERVFIVGVKGMESRTFPWMESKTPMTPLADMLEDDPPQEAFVSDRIRKSRQKLHSPRCSPAIWHENKGGNVSSHPFSCALRASASYNYLLVDGRRRLTKREMLRLQGFPDTYDIDMPTTTVRRLTGNAVAVPVVKAVVRQLLHVCA